MPANGTVPAAQKPAGAWSAEADFGGINPGVSQPYTRWDRYAQTLLMTNEFSFVD